MSTADCVRLLVEERGGDPKDWKRQSKKQECNLIVRVFKNTKTKTLVRVEEDPEGNLRIGETGSIPTAGGAIQGDQMKVDFQPKPASGDLSGKIIYSMGDDEDEQDPEWVPFYCGPETKDGFLEDQGDNDTATKLEQLFADFPGLLDVNASENFHMMRVPVGMTVKATEKLIKDRLVRSGAVKMRDF
jgi:hypothetical protein